MTNSSSWHSIISLVDLFMYFTHCKRNQTICYYKYGHSLLESTTSWTLSLLWSQLLPIVSFLLLYFTLNRNYLHASNHLVLIRGLTWRGYKRGGVMSPHGYAAARDLHPTSVWPVGCSVCCSWCILSVIMSLHCFQIPVQSVCFWCSPLGQGAALIANWLFSFCRWGMG